VSYVSDVSHVCFFATFAREGGNSKSYVYGVRRLAAVAEKHTPDTPDTFCRRPVVRPAEYPSDPRHEVLRVRRVHGHGAPRVRIVPSDPATLPPSIQGPRAFAQALHVGVVARVRACCDVLAHVASLPPRCPTIPTARSARRGPNGRVCQTGRNSHSRIGTFPNFLAADGRGNANRCHLTFLRETLFSGEPYADRNPSH